MTTPRDTAMTEAVERLAAASKSIAGGANPWSVAAAILAADPVLAAAIELGLAWQEAEAALPEGWLFMGISLVDHSMDGGDWGPDWWTGAQQIKHCERDDCEHDEATAGGIGATPAAALRALAARLREAKP